MARRPAWWHILQASRKEARLAIDLYNRSASERSLEAFVIHMHLAWLHLMHARFLRDGIDYRYRKPNGHFERIDGEIKTWDLARCIREEYPSESDPVRRNVEFFIILRNKIEHRYEELLAIALASKTQALVVNFEEALVSKFGQAEGLAEELRFPVFLSSLTPGAVDSLKATYRRLPKGLTTFIRDHDSSLPHEIQGDWRYDFRVLLLAQSGPKAEADAVMRFVREEEMTDEQREARDVVQTIVRHRQVPVQNKGKHKPGTVARKVGEAIGVDFPISDHTRAWKYFKARPPQHAARPDITDDRYCVWDEPHGDYLYSDAWVIKLSREMANPRVYSKVTGKNLPS